MCNCLKHCGDFDEGGGSGCDDDDADDNEDDTMKVFFLHAPQFSVHYHFC
jgi:hypothetical protein